jgi:hypothetical protein
MKKGTTMKIKPIQFNFSEEAYKKLEALREDLDVSSKTEIIRLALAVLSWIVEELKAGHTILVEKEPGKATELAFPFLRISSREKRSAKAEGF